MPLEFSCFISYPHGQGTVIKTFIEQLRGQLSDRIEPFVRMPPFHDEERLAPGFLYNPALAGAICRSIGMIVVYTPQYESSDYCLRELAAMEGLERRRLKLIRRHLDVDQGMIFPIILRKLETAAGAPKLPKWITDRAQYSDFSRFKTGFGDIFDTPPVIAEIEKIAQGVRRLYDAYIDLEKDPCSGCDRFTLPGLEAISDRLRQPKWNVRFPGRGGRS
jgi:hypothetical protein